MSDLLRIPFAALILFLLAPSVHAEPQAIGETSKIIKRVVGTVEDVNRSLIDADKVHRRELIETSGNSATKLVFADGSTLSVGPDSDVLLDEFVYAGGEEDTSIITLTKGVIRFVSGSMRKQGVEIRTPAATIGIRGTNFALLFKGNGSAYLLMDKEGACTIAGTCSGKTGSSLATCQKPLDVDLGQVARVKKGNAPELASDIAQAMGDQDNLSSYSREALGYCPGCKRWTCCWRTVPISNRDIGLICRQRYYPLFRCCRTCPMANSNLIFPSCRNPAPNSFHLRRLHHHYRPRHRGHLKDPSRSGLTLVRLKGRRPGLHRDRR